MSLVSSSTGDHFTLAQAYDYTPVEGVLIAAIVVFAIQTVITLIQFFRSGARLTLWVALFVASECAGYIAFEELIHDTTNKSAYLAELILIILAPNIVTLVDYNLLSYILPSAGFDAKSRLTRIAQWVPVIFVCSDLLCLTIQSIGGSQLATANRPDGSLDTDKYNLGKNLLLIGISLQMGFQALFALIAVYCYVKMPDKSMKQRLKLTWACLLITLLLVSIRNIYRIIEFASGKHSKVDATEVPYDILDLLMMATIGVVFIVLDVGKDSVLPVELRNGAAKGHDTKSIHDVETGKNVKSIEIANTNGSTNVV